MTINNIKRNLFTHYGIEVDSIKQLDHGQYGKNLKITTNTKQEFFCKIFTKESISNASIKTFKQSVKLVNFIADIIGDDHVARPLTNTEGNLIVETGDYIMTLSHFIHGEVYGSRSDVPDKTLAEIGEYLGLLHKKMSETQNSPVSELADISFLDKIHRHYEQTMKDKKYSHSPSTSALVQVLRKFYPEYIEQDKFIKTTAGDKNFKESLILIHGDPSIDNWIVRDQAPPILVDWDTAALGHPEADVHFFGNERFPAFVGGYALANDYMPAANLLMYYIIRNQNLLLSIVLNKLHRYGASEDYSNDIKLLNKYYWTSQHSEKLSLKLSQQWKNKIKM